MSDKGNIISTSVSEAVEKIPAVKKDYRKCNFMCFTLYSQICCTKNNFVESQTNI